MINFLKNQGISDDTLIEIVRNNEESSLFDLSCNSENCIKILDYMKQLGINNIDELLINRIDVFSMTFDEFIKKISKFNIPVIVSLINNDYSAIEILYE